MLTSNCSLYCENPLLLLFRLANSDHARESRSKCLLSEYQSIRNQGSVLLNVIRPVQKSSQSGWMRGRRRDEENGPHCHCGEKRFRESPHAPNGGDPSSEQTLWA